MAEFMQLTLRRFPVRAIQFGPRTELTGDALSVNRDELVALLQTDPRVRSVAVDAADPGDNCRIVHVQDVIEPRVKVEGPGTVFPGFLGDGRPVGSGITHCLSGMAVVSCGEIQTKASSGGPASVTGPRNRIIDMAGPAAMLSPFSHTVNLTLTYHPAPHVSPEEFDAAIRRVVFGRRAIWPEPPREAGPRRKSACTSRPPRGCRAWPISSSCRTTGSSGTPTYTGR